MKQVLVTVTLLWTLVLCVEQDVTCLFSEDCVLPCSFKPFNDEVIHWYRQGSERPVYSFYQGSDQLQYQDQRYKGRTSLFSGQITKGNASLLLRVVKPQDQGRYKCYTSTSLGNVETFVNIKFKAPIKSVDISVTGDNIICSSKGIDPEPTVSWSTDPPSDQEGLNSSTHSSKDEQGLYSVNSTLRILQNYTSICSISSQDGTQRWTASLRQQKKISSGMGQNLTIPCTKLDAQDYLLTWIFNSITPILSYESSTNLTIYDQWRDKVRGLTKTGDIELHNLNSIEFSGMYTCERTTANSRHLVHTSVQITAPHSDGLGTLSLPIAIGISVLLFAIIVAVIIAYKIKRGRGKKTKDNGKEETALNGRPERGNVEMAEGESENEGLNGKDCELYPAFDQV